MARLDRYRIGIPRGNLKLLTVLHHECLHPSGGQRDPEITSMS